MTRRSYIRIASYILVSLSVVIAFAIINTRNMNDYKQQLEVNYQHSLNELSECLDTVSCDLTKSLYSNSPEELSDISRDLYAQCSSAKNALSRLPVSQMELSNTYKFLSQASDYAQYIGTKIENGEAISEQEHKNLVTLLGYAEEFSKSADEMVSIVSAGARITDGSVKSAAEVSPAMLSDKFSVSAKTFESFPTLLYDGPFSDRVLNKKSEMVGNSKVKSKEDCLSLVSSYLGVSESKIAFEADEKSVLPCYTFKSGRYTVSLTKQGGYVKNMLYSGIISSSQIGADEAVKAAQDFLTKIGYKNMRQSYYAIQNNICTVNFAYCENEVYYYSDLIKVSVSMEDARVLAVDAQTYLTNHTKRQPFSYEVSMDEAEKRLSPYLTVSSRKKCVIPKENGTEKQCYEFLCTSRDTGEDSLIYINTDTGEEEDIMLLLYTDGGTMVK